MLLHTIDQVISFNPSKTAYLHGTDRMTYSGLSDYANEVASALVRHGFRPNERVAVQMEASVAYPAALLGIWRANGVAVPLDGTLSEFELSHFLNVSQARFIITDPKADTDPSVPRQISIRKLPPDGHSDATRNDSDTDMLVLFSSGTTGAPKGILHTQTSLEALVKRHNTFSNISSDDVVLAGSLFHTGFGLHSYILSPLLAGASVVIVHPFLPRDALETVHREHVTWIQTVPAILKLMTAVKPTPSLPSLKTVWLGAATLDDDSRRDFVAKFGIQPIQGYGMNEIGRIASTSRLTTPPTGRTVGYPEVDVRIFRDDGAPARRGEPGEIGVSAASLCRPFYLSPDGAREPLPIHDGYFLTGDLARLNDDGLLELLGRLKTFILTPRFKVDPAEVEEVLLEHPSVAEAAVIPVPGRSGYEEVRAIVATSTPVRISELLSFCSSKLPSGKCPQSIVLVDRLPRNSLGKVEIGKLLEDSRSPFR